MHASAAETDVRTLSVRRDLGEFGPVTRHHWWRQAMRLSSSDPGVDEHLSLCELPGHGTQYVQLNLPVALSDAVSRWLQLWEQRHAEKLHASTASGG